MAAKERKEKPKIKKSAIGFDDVVGHKHIKERLQGIIKIINKSIEIVSFDMRHNNYSQ